MTLSGRRRFLIVAVAVVPLLLVGQQSTTTGQSGSSNPDAFCSSWDEARSALLGETVEKSGDGGQSFDDALEQQLEIIDSTDALVPPEIRAEWDAAADFRRAVTDLLFTVDPDRVRPIHLELAFGDADPEPLEANAMAAVAAIDEWTVTGCGDFCDRWPEIEQAVLVDDQDLDPGLGEPSERNQADMRLLTAIDPLVPEELRSAWDDALASRSVLTDALAVNPEAPWWYFEDRGINFDEYLDELARLVEPISAWALANCDAAATRSDAPGTLTVRLQLTDDSLGKTAFIAVVEAGAPITGLASNGGVLGSVCQPIFEPPSQGQIETPIFEPEGSSWLCNLGAQGGGEGVRLDAGTYDVVVSTVTGLTDANLSRFIPPPDRCVRFPVVIGGDTDVDAPPLEPCELGPIAGDPADAAALRAPVVDPGEPGAGTLTVILSDAISPTSRPDVDVSSQEASGSFLAIALPSGTTLDEVGRHEVWPSGAVCIDSVTAEFAATRGAEDEDQAMRARSVPLLVLPPTGVPPPCLPPWATDSDGRLGHGAYVPVTLAQGVYDLYLEANPEPLGAIGLNSDGRRCFRQEVEIDGDVEIAVPPATDWEVCP